MRLFCCLVYCLLIFVESGYSQNLYSHAINDVNNGWEYYTSHLKSEDSSCLVLGTTVDFFADDSTYYRRFFIDKLDKDLHVLNRKIYAYKDRELNGLFEFHSFNNSKAFIDVQHDINDSLNIEAHLNYINEDGEIVFTRKLNANPLSGYAIIGCAINEKKEFVFCIKYGRYTTDSFYLCSTDSLGNILWTQNHFSIHNVLMKIVTSKNNTYLLSGYVPERLYFKIGKDGFPVYAGYPDRLWLAQFDSIGQEVWQKTFTGEYYEPRDSLYDQIGPRTFGSFFKGGIELNKSSYLGYGVLSVYPYLVNIDHEGKIIWERKIDEFAVDSIRKTDYTYRLVFQNVMLHKGYLYALASDGENNFFYKLTLSGKVLWKREYIYQKGGFNFLPSMSVLSDGFVLMGSARDSNNWDKQQDAWMLTLDTNGCLSPGCNKDDIIDTLTGLWQIPKSKKELSIQVYPNPTSRQFSIETEIQYARILLFSMSGKNLKEQLHDEASSQIDVSTLPEGIYVLQLYSREGGMVHVQKVTIRH